MSTETLYLAVSARADSPPPFASLTEASLWVIGQDCPSDWRVDQITAGDARLKSDMDRSLRNAVAYGRHFDAFMDAAFGGKGSAT